MIDEATSVKLCIHYDPALLPLPRSRTLAATAGAAIAAEFGHLFLDVIERVDMCRPTASGVVTAPRALGIRRLLMMSGDNQRVAQAVARHVGLHEARGGLMPKDKVATVKALRQEQPVAPVYDPSTGQEMSFEGAWDMGHKYGYEFYKHRDSALERGISRKQFLDEYNNVDHYRPELPASNRSHKGEAASDIYFGD